MSTTQQDFRRRRLASFTGRGYSKGRSLPVVVAWVALGDPITRAAWLPSRARVAILRMFGASIGRGVNIRNGVRVHWPWKLTIGDDSWIGVGAYLLNLEPIAIGSDVCISQEVFLCTGSHDADDPAFEYDNAPIDVGDGAWIAARATVLRGVRIGQDAVVGATALATKDVPAGARLFARRSELREPQ